MKYEREKNKTAENNSALFVIFNNSFVSIALREGFFSS
jgi:hypothetical protein